MAKSELQRRSAHARGRRRVSQNEALELIIEATGISKKHFKKVFGMEPGADIRPKTKIGRRWFPFAVEVKFVEKLSVWAAIKQAETYQRKKLAPLVLFRRARSPWYVILGWEHFKKMLPGESGLEAE